MARNQPNSLPSKSDIREEDMDYLYVGGSFDSGLIIEADLPSHLAGSGPRRRGVILTPVQSMALWSELQALRAKEFSHE